MVGDGQQDQLNDLNEPVDAEASVQSPEPGDRESPSRKSQIGETGEVDHREGESLFEEPLEMGLKDGRIQVEEPGKGEYEDHQDGNNGEGGSQDWDNEEGNSKEEEQLEEMERKSLKVEHLETESRRGNSPTENRKENGEELSLEKDEVSQDHSKEAEENNTGGNKGKDGESPQGEGEVPTNASPQLAGFRALYPAPEGLSLLKPHQSDNLSAITEENSNIGDESTNKSFTEEEKEIEEAEDNYENDGKRYTVFSQVSSLSPQSTVCTCCTIDRPTWFQPFTSLRVLIIFFHFQNFFT